MHLLLLSEYLTYAFILGSFMYNGIGKILPSCIYPTKYLIEAF